MWQASKEEGALIFSLFPLPPIPIYGARCTGGVRETGEERAGGGTTKRARSRIKRGKVLSNALYFALEKGLKGEIHLFAALNSQCS